MAGKKQQQKELTKKKEFISKDERKLLLIATGIALFLFLSVYIAFRIDFYLQEEIQITLETPANRLFVNNSDFANLAFTTKLHTPASCVATCTETITDLSTTKDILNNTFQFSGNTDHIAQAESQILQFGYGNKIYAYQINCANRQTQTCPGGDDTYSRNSLTFVQYEPNEQNKQTLQEYEDTYTKLTLNLNMAEETLAILLDALNSTRHTNTNNISSDLEMLRLKLEELQLQEEKMKQAWNSQNYDLLTPEQTTTAVDARTFAEETYKDLKERITLHEQAILRLNSTKQHLEQINKIILLAQQNENMSVELQNEIDRLESTIRNVVFELQQKSFETYSTINAQLDSIKLLTENISNNTLVEYSKTTSTSISLEAGRLLICAATGNNSCTASINNTIQKSKILSIENTSILAEEECRQATELAAIMKIQNDEDDLDEDVRNEIRKLLLSNLIKIEVALKSENITDERLKVELSKIKQNISANMTEEEIDKANETYYPANYNKSLLENLDASSNEIYYKIQQLADKCNNTQQTILFQIPALNTDEPIEELNTTNTTGEYLPTLLPQCCTYNSCNPCGESKKVPLILLHGHSFSGKKSASSSTEALTNLENSLAAEGLYIPLGYADLNEYNKYSEKIREQNIPVTLKTTYYIDLGDSKDESIDTYAIRLNTVIEQTKQITGSDKVDIVAHSMGGLVTRRYAQVFGSESINKLILVGTPNKGIDDNTANLCKIFGATRECEDMKEGSQFITKLNSAPNTIPHTHVILGEGCEMSNGKDGDGIAIADNVRLENSNITVIKGKCDGIDYLHGKLIDPQKNNEAYETIKAALSNN